MTAEPAMASGQSHVSREARRVTISGFEGKDAPQAIKVTEPTIARVEAAILGNPRKVASKEHAPQWAFAKFRDNYRNLPNVVAVYALGFDDDVAALPWNDALGIWGSLGLAGVIHTTASHRPDAPRYRVFLWPSRSVDAEEYRQLWRWCERRLSELGHRIGQEAKDPCRAWYVPVRIGENEYLAALLEGAPLDVDRVLAEERQQEDQERAHRGRDTTRWNASTPYAQGALESASQRIASAPEGERNATLNKEAFSIGQLVGAGVLDRASAESELHDAARAAGLGEAEIRSTLHSGLNAGEREPRNSIPDGPERPFSPIPPISPTAEADDMRPRQASVRAGGVKLGDAAYRGLVGAVVRAYCDGGYTEASRAAVAAHFLVGFGSMVGRNAYFRVGPVWHYPNEFLLAVGPSGTGGKGEAFAAASEVLKAADPEWRIRGALSSGEGLISAVRDPVYELNSNGVPVLVDEGVEDKRLLAYQAEFSSVLKNCERQGNNLSQTVRDFWDSPHVVESLTRSKRGARPDKATDAHVSIIAHTTPADLVRHTSDTEAANGFLNRFLPLLIEREAKIPEPGPLPEETVRELTVKVKTALEAARNVGEMKRTERASEVWGVLYDGLSDPPPGLVGSMLSRGAPHVARLSMIYALLDGSAVIDAEHIESAAAFWDGVAESVTELYWNRTGNRDADQIAEAFQGGDAMTLTEIRDKVFRSHSFPSHRIQAAIDLLVSLPGWHLEERETGGRPATVLVRTSRPANNGRNGKDGK